MLYHITISFFFFNFYNFGQKRWKFFQIRVLLFFVRYDLNTSIELVTLMYLFCLDKDWEDIKKMPEHGTLLKDFKKAK